jgi:hypothetical protein
MSDISYQNHALNISGTPPYGVPYTQLDHARGSASGLGVFRPTPQQINWLLG